MKILITGICGFVGSTLAQGWMRSGSRVQLCGLDNLIRPGSELNREKFRRLGIPVFHGDVRSPTDFDALPDVDFVVDAAANPSVLAGVDGRSSSRQVVEHNLGGTINVLEFCRARRAGLIILSTSRVYSIASLLQIQLEPRGDAFAPVPAQAFPPGVSAQGVTEDFSTAPPLSLYGATKMSSEIMALDYGQAFGFPVWINRCGVMAGPGQFGHAEQGIFSFWLHAWASRRPLRYIGWGGAGHQVRDALHPADILPVLDQQMQFAGSPPHRVFNLGGGTPNAMSLANLSQWCRQHLGPHTVAADATPRAYDVPWLVMDSARAKQCWNWAPVTPLPRILDDIADFARQNPGWLDLSAPPQPMPARDRS